MELEIPNPFTFIFLAERARQGTRVVGMSFIVEGKSKAAEILLVMAALSKKDVVLPAFPCIFGCIYRFITIAL